MTHFSAVEKTNRPRNYHKLPFVIIVMILTVLARSGIQGTFSFGFNVGQIFGKFATFG